VWLRRALSWPAESPSPVRYDRYAAWNAGRDGGQENWNEPLQVGQAIASCSKNDNRDIKIVGILLEGKVSVDRNKQDVVSNEIAAQTPVRALIEKHPHPIDWTN
jgi:hypothetical protein